MPTQPKRAARPKKTAKMDERLVISVSTELAERARRISEISGVPYSEIARRGLVRQLDLMEGVTK